MTFDPYIHFMGNCREAMQAYQKIFGGELQMMRYGDTPDAKEDAKTSDRLMHASLTIDGHRLLASDFPPGFAGERQQAVSISYTAKSTADGKRIFDLLSDGGALVMPYEATFWSDGFGMVKDRFGTHWMVSAPQRQQG